MIRKPTGAWQRESAAVTNLRTVATGLGAVAASGAATARVGGQIFRGAVCWAFTALWGFAALAAGLSGSLQTFVGVGALAAFMAWNDNRLFAKARAGGRVQAR